MTCETLNADNPDTTVATDVQPTEPSSSTEFTSDLSTGVGEGPRQPQLSSFPKTHFNKQNRSFSSFMYARFPFIEYSVSNDAVFCFACRNFPDSSANVDSTFTVTGFRQWKRLSERLTKHSTCSSHLESMSAWMGRKSAEQAGSVFVKIMQQSNSAVDRNREAVATLARLCIFCGQHDLALRGHDESATSTNPGIFRSFVALEQIVNKSFKETFELLPKNATYTSKDSQNDLLSAAKAVITGVIVDEIKSAGMFTVIADDARDVSCTEQTSVCVRYVIGSTVKERFLQFVDVHELDASSLANVIISTLTEIGLDITKCVAQCYDGASVMSGKLSGVQARVREMCGTACIYIHCHAHRLNLVLVDACSEIQCLTDVIGLMQAIHCFVRASTIRHDMFKNVQLEAGLIVMELPKQSDTRWVCKHKAVTVFKLRLQCVLKTLEHFAEQPGRNGKERAEAKGLLLQLKTPKVCFILEVLDLIFPIVNCASKYMQGKSADIATATDLVFSTIVAMEEMRNDDTFQNVYQRAMALFDTLGFVNPSIPSNQLINKPVRVNKVPARLQDFVVMARSGSRDVEQSNDTFRKDMFEIIDTMIEEMRTRFEHQKPELLACSTFMPSGKNFMDYEIMAPLAMQYQILDINCDRLKGQVTVAKDMLTKASLKDPEDVLELLFSMKTAFPDLALFGQLILTMPVSSANAERSFSALKRVKTYLRSTMAEQRLNNLCIMSIERELSSSLLENINPVLDTFAQMKNRRANLLKT